MSPPRARVVFVCLGNICRSPTAEGVFRDLVKQAGLDGAIAIDSAGTSAYHVGESPDPRSTAAAARHGVDLRGAARQFVAADFDRFDYIVAMDRHNHSALRKLVSQPAHTAKLSLMREHEPDGGQLDVPDPYYGSGDGFENVYQICRRSCEGLLDAIRAQHGL